jgi:hypothetical protein
VHRCRSTSAWTASRAAPFRPRRFHDLDGFTRSEPGRHFCRQRPWGFLALQGSSRLVPASLSPAMPPLLTFSARLLLPAERPKSRADRRAFRGSGRLARPPPKRLVREPSIRSAHRLRRACSLPAPPMCSAPPSEDAFASRTVRGDRIRLLSVSRPQGTAPSWACLLWDRAPSAAPKSAFRPFGPVTNPD